jgi:predicted Zn-dependent protease
MSVRYAATFNDGRSAAQRDVSVELVAAGLRVVAVDGLFDELWPTADLRLIDDWLGADAARIARISDAEARLSLRGPGVRDALIAHVPDLRQARRRNVWRTLGVVGGSIAVIVALFALFWFALPLVARPLAQYIPERYVERLGQVLERQVFDRFPSCANDAGQAALERLVQRLVAAAPRPVNIRVRVIRRPLVNALATPGGRIYVFAGLIDAAGSGEEVAGVLAHEIAHEVHRHGIEAAVRYVFVSSVLSVVTGGETTIATAAAWAGEQLLQFAYSRDAEAEADRTALEILKKAGIRSDGFAAFFGRLEKVEQRRSRIPTYLRTHPPSSERRSVAEQAAGQGGPAMSEEDWRAIRALCRANGG